MNGRMDRASATETIHSSSILGQVYLNTIKIDIHSA